MPDERETERLRRLQSDRAQREHELAEQTPDPEERQTHERRSERASYLEEKLQEQQQAPDD